MTEARVTELAHQLLADESLTTNRTPSWPRCTSWPPTAVGPTNATQLQSISASPEAAHRARLVRRDERVHAAFRNHTMPSGGRERSTEDYRSC
jgi:hypothetical protein